MLFRRKKPLDGNDAELRIKCYVFYSFVCACSMPYHKSPTMYSRVLHGLAMYCNGL